MRTLRRSLTSRGGAFAGSGLLLVLGGMLLGLSDLIRIGVLLLASVALAMAWGRRPTAFDVSRTVTPERVTVDQGAVVTVRITNRARTRSPLGCASEVIAPSLGDRPRVIVGAMAPGHTREFQYTVRPHVRGIHALGPLRLEVRDPFGLTARPALVQGQGTLVVLPRVHPLATSRRLLGGTGSDGSIPQGLALHAEDDQSVRDYRDGDDLRRIHWPATARTGDLMVRQEDRPTRRQALILLDTRSAAHSGSGRSSTLEWAVSMTASITGHLVRHAHRVELITADPGSAQVARTDDGLEAALVRLAEVQLDGSTSLTPLLHTAQERATTGGLVIAIVGGLADDSLRVLTALRPHGSRGLAFVIHPANPTADPQAERPARGTLAGLRASGWEAVAVDGSTPPPQAWSLMTGADAAVAR